MRRTPSPVPAVPTLGELHRQTMWLWLDCPACNLAAAADRGPADFYDLLLLPGRPHADRLAWQE